MICIMCFYITYLHYMVTLNYIVVLYEVGDLVSRNKQGNTLMYEVAWKGK